MSGNETLELIAAIFIFAGGVLSMLSALGLLRFPDVYTRNHAGTKSTTLAVLVTLAGVFMYFWVVEGLISVRLFLGILFVFITAPTAGHILVRAAYRSGVELSDSTVEDELEPVLRQKGSEREDER
ncbi:monovalent cation/H(+) antiporter subunit G [Virgibacillus kimchii]